MRQQAEPVVDQGWSGLAPFARRPVYWIAGVLGVVLLVTSALGGYWFDELYFVAAGHHLSWGYADQPWLVPLLAAGLDALAPGSTLVLRLPSTILTAVGVVVLAQLARELGGGRRAQILAGGTYAIAWSVVANAHWLATYTLDPFFWVLIIWLVVRWIRLHEQGQRADVLLLWAGVVTAVALQTKFLVPLLWLGVGIGVLLSGPRDLLRRPMLWLGAAVSVVVTLPTLLWQAAHGWPYLAFSQVVGTEAKRLELITSLPTTLGIVGFVFLCYGLWRLYRSERLRPFRFLGWAVAVVFLACLVLDGRAYYPIGINVTVFAVAAVEFERRALPRWSKWITWPGYVLSTLGAATMLTIVVLTSGFATDRSLSEPVASAYHSLDAQTRESTAVVAEIYPSAAALHHYADEMRLPRVYSPHRGYWYFGHPPETIDTVLFAGDKVQRLAPYFSTARPLNRESTVWLLEGRTVPWSTLWPHVRFGLTSN